MRSTSKSKRQKIAILASLTIKSGEARSWWSINISEIDNIQNDDPVFKKSSQLLLEDTYFLFGRGDDYLNTDTPPTPPNINVFPQQQPPWPNNNYNNASVYPVQVSPTSTDNPVESPSLSPSMIYQAANGGCPPEQTLHRLWLYDSYGDAQYGDGWGTTTLQIRETSSTDVIFEGTLDAKLGATRHAVDGSMVDGHIKHHNDQQRRLEGTSEDNAVYICLNENVCYTGEISGGTFREECSWELTKVALETGGNAGLVAKGVGGGLGKCEFGMSDGCNHTCDGKFYSLLGCFTSLADRTLTGLIHKCCLSNCRHGQNKFTYHDSKDS